MTTHPIEAINTIRHDPLFPWREYATPIHVIGEGGVGGYVVEILTQLGCGQVNELHGWDGDHISDVNPANQIYLPEDVGKSKAETLAEYMRRRSPTIKPVVHPEFVTSHIDLSGVVFICVDKMSVRKMLMEESIGGNKKITLMIEVRINARHIIIHVIDPCNEKHRENWWRWWYPDEEAINDGGCGGHLSIATTVHTAAAIATDQLIRHAAIQRGSRDILDNQIVITMRPLEMKLFKW